MTLGIALLTISYQAIHANLSLASSTSSIPGLAFIHSNLLL
ncbi:MAG: hypothetical protein WA915_15845 [Candidatus Aminicenantaceae bacterium]